MPRQRNIDKLQQAEQAARDELARSQAALKNAQANLRKVRQQERERVIHELGHLAYEAGLHQLDRDTLKARFASLAVEGNLAVE